MKLPELVVGINAQINPNSSGGSESSAMSIVEHFRRNAGPRLTFKVISIPRFATDMARFAGSPERVIKWPIEEFGPIGADAVTSPVRALQARSGPLRPLVDAGVRQIRRLRAAMRRPSAATIDGLLDEQRIDLVHFTYPMTFPTRKPFIYEPHDIQHCHYPEFFPPYILEWRKRTYTEGIAQATYVVCGSWWTKFDIMDKYGAPASKIAVIPRDSVKARDDLSDEQVQHIQVELKLPARFALYPAMSFPHKNHIRLLEAMAALKAEGVLVQLVCTGRIYKPHQPEIEATIDRLGLRDQVRFLGSVPEDVLTACYRLSTYVVFPSLLEGLSQSLLESLYQGKAIAAAQQSSIPETVGQAGLLFDGLDVDSITAALRRMETDPGEVRRLEDLARREVKRFDWGEAITTLFACYRSAAGLSLTPDEKRLLDIATAERPPQDLHRAVPEPA